MQSIVMGLAQRIYDGEKITYDPDLLQATVKPYLGGIAKGYGKSLADVDWDTPDAKTLQKLTENVVQFSASKDVHILSDRTAALKGSDGKMRSFDDFQAEVDKMNVKYNQNWLRTEYNQAVASSQAAARWTDYEKHAKSMPFLQYQAVMDGNTRAEHAALNGVIKRVDSDFWDKYYPPNGWGCRCTVVQVRKSKYPETPHDEAMQRGQQALAKDTRGMFRFNPGIERKTFPDYNPYTIRRCRDCDIANGKAKLAFVPDNELCAACQLVRQCEDQRFEVKRKFDNGSKVSVHRLVNDKDSDYSKLMEIAESFAKTYGEDVKLTPKMSRPQRFVYQNIYHSLMGTKYEGTCPDLLVGNRWYEHEGFISKKPKNAFRNMLNDGLKQSDRLIIDRPDLTERYMMRSIVNRINEGQKITEVWLREKDGSLSLLFKKTDG